MRLKRRDVLLALVGLSLPLATSSCGGGNSGASSTAAFSGTTTATASGGKAPDKIRIGYQVIPNGELLAKALGLAKQAFPNSQVQYISFDSGRDVNTAIARTLAAEPQLILMDEPFGALDALTRESMQIHLKDIWQRTHKTIFFITHDVEESLLLATRIIVMHAGPGRIVHDLANPFVHRSGSDPGKLRLSKEFVEMREFLVNSIRNVNSAPVGVA